MLFGEEIPANMKKDGDKEAKPAKKPSRYFFR
jgi:hypothetical protein